MSFRRVGHALASAAQDGYRVGVVDGRVRVRRVCSEGADGRAAPAMWRSELRALDPRNLARLLVVDVAVAIEGLDEDVREAFEERAAILEHEAGVERSLAERVAWCWCGEVSS